jgi:hypothetical protein
MCERLLTIEESEKQVLVESEKQVLVELEKQVLVELEKQVLVELEKQLLVEYNELQNKLIINQRWQQNVKEDINKLKGQKHG